MITQVTENYRVKTRSNFCFDGEGHKQIEVFTLEVYKKPAALLLVTIHCNQRLSVG